MTTFLEKIKFRINRLFTHTTSIPDISEKRILIETYILKFKPAVFVETGTFLGDTTNHFKDHFDELYSIELSTELAAKAAKRFEAINHVHIIQGNSVEVLAGILKKMSGTILFWLDGHYSSEFFIKDEFIQTAKGESNTPILKELKIVLASGKRSVILIDDARLFTGKNDYPTIKTIKEMVSKTNLPLKLLVSKDIIQIFPSE